MGVATPLHHDSITLQHRVWSPWDIARTHALGRRRTRAAHSVGGSIYVAVDVAARTAYLNGAVTSSNFSVGVVWIVVAIGDTVCAVGGPVRRTSGGPRAFLGRRWQIGILTRDIPWGGTHDGSPTLEAAVAGTTRRTRTMRSTRKQRPLRGRHLHCLGNRVRRQLFVRRARAPRQVHEGVQNRGHRAHGGPVIATSARRGSHHTCCTWRPRHGAAGCGLRK